MFDLYFAGQVTDHVDKCLFDMGANHLFSFLNERKNIDRWIRWVDTYGKKGKLFIDSGAFTAWTKGTYINVDDYIYFLMIGYSILTFLGSWIVFLETSEINQHRHK